MSVLEAVLAALLVTTGLAILLVTSHAPPPDAGVSTDLSHFANDILISLANRPSEDPAHPDWLTQQVNSSLDGTAPALEAFLNEAVPPGARYQLRISNGVEPLRLLPGGAGAKPPLAGQAATVLVTPAWNAHSGPATAELLPGEDYDTTLILCVSSPAGTTARPDGDDWLTHWTSGAPRDAPFGLWALYTLPTCTGPATIVQVVPRAGDTDAIPYALQLVVWQGA